MIQKLGFGVFGTFGQPFGFQQTFYFDVNINQSLDLNGNAIEVYPNTELYMIKREICNDVSSICFSIYTYAKEPNSNRGGTFIGSCIVLQDCFIKPEYIINLLSEFHADIVNNEINIFDNIIRVQQVESLIVAEPMNYDKYNATKKSSKNTKYDFLYVDPSKKYFIIPNELETDKNKVLISFFEKALDEFGSFDTLYFSFDKSIIQYVLNKGLINTRKWEDFLSYKKTNNNVSGRDLTKLNIGVKNTKNIINNNSSIKSQNKNLNLEQWRHFTKDDKITYINGKVNEHNLLLNKYKELVKDYNKLVERMKIK